MIFILKNYFLSHCWMTNSICTVKRDSRSLSVHNEAKREIRKENFPQGNKGKRETRHICSRGWLELPWEYQPVGVSGGTVSCFLPNKIKIKPEMNFRSLFAPSWGGRGLFQGEWAGSGLQVKLEVLVWGVEVEKETGWSCRTGGYYPHRADGRGWRGWVGKALRQTAESDRSREQDWVTRGEASPSRRNTRRSWRVALMGSSELEENMEKYPKQDSKQDAWERL